MKDVFLYVFSAMIFGALGYLSTEEAYKYCPVILLFWLKGGLAVMGAGANAWKAFRSMVFARQQGMKMPGEKPAEIPVDKSKEGEASLPATEPPKV